MQLDSSPERRGQAGIRPSLLSILLAGLLIAPVAGAADDAPPIDLDSFLAAVRSTHPLFPAEDLAPRIESARREELGSARDWRLGARGGWTYREPISTSTFAPRWTEVFDLNSSVERAVWATGGRFAVEWTSRWTEQQLPSIEVPSPQGFQSIETGAGTLFRTGLSLRFSQPLLRNRGGTLDRLEYDAAEYGIDVAGLQARERQEAFLLELGSMFVGWAQWHRLRDVAADRVDVAEEQLDLVRDLRESNLVDRVDVLRAEESLAAARRGLSTVEAELRGQRAALAELAQIEDLTRRTPSIALTDTVALDDLQTVLAELRGRARRLQVVDERRRAVQLRRDGAAESEDPTLDLDLDVGIAGGDRDSYGSAWALDSPDVGAALVFRQQLGAGRAEAAREQADLELRRLDHRRQQTELDLRSQVARQRARLGGLADALALHERQVEIAERKAAAERDLYSEGRNPLTFVLQAQDAEQAAREAWIRTGAQYRRALLAYRAVIDRLLDEPPPGDGS